MGVLDRIGKVVKAEWNHRFSRRPGEPGPAPREALSPTANQRRAAVVDVDGALRVLELTTTPSLAAVRAQYQKLARRYYPKSKSASADEAHAAVVVLDVLTDALEVLEEHLLPLA